MSVDHIISPLPESFNDNVIVKVLNQQLDGIFNLHTFELTYGLLIKLKAALIRVYKKGPHRLPPENHHVQLFYLVEQHALISMIQCLHDAWNPETLWSVATEVSVKATNISPLLQHQLNSHALLPRSSSGRMMLDTSFLHQVKAYHRSVQRPEGTFSVKISECLESLAALPRESCPSCNGCRQVYCGTCCGLRLASAEPFLPRRITLPFDILLLVHWQESLHKCTGVHAGAMCNEGSVRWRMWSKDKSDKEWGDVVGALDPSRDVLLFPSNSAVDARHFDWGAAKRRGASEEEWVSSSIQGSNVVVLPVYTEPESDFFADNTADKTKTDASSSDTCTNGIIESGRDSEPSTASPKESCTADSAPRWRLVVLEGSWNYAKTMAMQIAEYREKAGLPALPCVILHEVVGEYWRFQTEGNSAVSTIEAIAHTARAAGLPQSQYDDLLTLFYLQKFRVMGRIGSGGRAPKAVDVCGYGLGGWRDLTDGLGETVAV